MIAYLIPRFLGYLAAWLFGLAGGSELDERLEVGHG